MVKSWKTSIDLWNKRRYLSQVEVEIEIILNRGKPLGDLWLEYYKKRFSNSLNLKEIEKFSNDNKCKVNK